jgi:hypothetical protein
VRSRGVPRVNFRTATRLQSRNTPKDIYSSATVIQQFIELELLRELTFQLTSQKISFVSSFWSCWYYIQDFLLQYIAGHWRSDNATVPCTNRRAGPLPAEAPFNCRLRTHNHKHKRKNNTKSSKTNCSWGYPQLAFLQCGFCGSNTVPPDWWFTEVDFSLALSQVS